MCQIYDFDVLVSLDSEEKKLFMDFFTDLFDEK